MNEKTVSIAVGKAMASIGKAFVLSAVVPTLKPLRSIGSNDVDVIRGVRPSKYAGLDRSTRVRFRAMAKASGMTVEAWMETTGNTITDRGVAPVMSDAIVARALGIRRGNLTATGVFGFTAVYDAAIRAAVASVANAQTVIGLHVGI